MRIRFASSRPTTTAIVSLLATIVTVFGFIASASEAQAEPSESVALTEESVTAFPDEKTIQSTLDEYLLIGLDGSKRFDTKRAAENNVDPRIVEIGEQANYLLVDYNTTKSDKQLRDLNPTNYGNWCGKNNSGPGDPINSLDRACMGHDHCLNIKRPVCDCDRGFVRKLREIRNHYSGWSRTYLEAAIVAVPLWHGCKV